MNNISQIDFLKREIEKSITMSQTKRSSNKRKAFFFQIAITILSATSTIILGLEIDSLKDNIRTIALVISTIITIISSVDIFFNHKRLWITHANTLNAMSALRFDFEFRLTADAELTSQELEDFRKRFQTVVMSGNEKWAEVRIDTIKHYE